MTRFHFDKSTCSYCKYTLNSTFELDVHIAKKHHQKNENGVICHLCEKQFPYRDTLLTHIRVVHHNYQPFKCDKCDKVFDVIQKLNSHKKTHGTTNDFHCDKCAKSFKTQGGLNNHQKSMHSEKNFHCDKCEFVTHSDHRLKEHFIRNHTTGTFVCDECGKIFTNPLSLEGHKQDVHDPRLLGEFKCTYEGCDAIFDRKRSLTSHVRNIHVHPGRKPHKCQYCPSTFKNPGDKIDHEKNWHLNIKDVECEICGYKTASKKRLKAHTRNVHGTNEYFCDYPGCSKSYGIKGNLDAHRARVHKIARPKATQNLN